MHVRGLGLLYFILIVVVVEFLVLFVYLAYDELCPPLVDVDRVLDKNTVIAFLLFFNFLLINWLEFGTDRVAIDLILATTVTDLLLDFFELADQ